MEVPTPINSTAALIDRHHEANKEKPRPHFGISQAGHPCERWLWYSFRWAVAPNFSGRMLRLFRRGHLEENTIIDDLTSIGCTVTDDQKRVILAPHLSGSIDGIVIGIPEAPKTPHLLEMKTHSLKSFKDLIASGVEKSKPQHFIQVQLYMHGLGLERALYYSVCKDDDTIYTERVKYDKEVALKYIERSTRIIASDRAPVGLIGNPTWYQCKMCVGHDLCYGSKQSQEKNCRTCANSRTTNDGWHCDLYDAPIALEHQRTGCDKHEFNLDLKP
jgi:hypothetical protein